MEEAAPITEYDRSDKVAEVKSFLDGVEEAKRCKRTDIERLRALIAEHQLVREHVQVTRGLTSCQDYVS
jgi:hypothetical protein